MGYEIKLKYHPKFEDSFGYDTEQKKEMTKKVGKAFDDTGLEQLAAALIAQMARRDILIYEVEVDELVRRSITVKECKDGRGIIVKGKRFSLDKAARLVEEAEVVSPPPASVPAVMPQAVHPHEQIAEQRRLQAAIQPASEDQVEDLYSNPQKAIVKHATPPVPVNQKKVLYWVYFEPYMWQAEVKSMKLRCTEDKKYPVHRVLPSPDGRLDNQKIIITDDTGQLVTLDEKYFTSAGKGLLGDEELGFSKPREQGRRPRLAYENEMINMPPADIPAGMENIPIDDGSIPAEMMSVPDLRRR